nr:T9SS type A sorting domain-containing protein [candidate division Zixibacteria bacterium]NIS15910.1 T9SS type A sorting domain-containing protein [candidate division Zixibacteria bacterium]NIS47350.1 T9SS type A sorting domain-containing protein [candidate division Zixibacteria bacterium]NIU15464.1 T9SS type A sorting domain-containing protein [candidate division Zixibacteria bacterium]NIV07558.1 T9SS type A sorting domain-containing protein [candidate division Zixibacteria bacterium]
PHIQISSFVAADGNDDIFESSEVVDLTLSVVSEYASINSLWARIFVADQYGQVLTDSAYFGYLESDNEGDNSSNPFVIQLSDDVRPGGRMPVDINFYDVNGEVINAGRIEVVVGQSQNAVFHTLSNGSFKLTVDNFGGIGHGENSPSPAGVIGFSPFESEFDILPEFSLMIAAGNEEHVSDAARSEAEFISDNDFLASREIEAVFENPGSFGSADLFGYYNDSLASEPLGVSIRQRTSIFNDPELENCVIIEYSILPENAVSEDLYYIGFLMDWDLADGGGGIEQSAFDFGGDFCYFYNQANDLYVGMRFLNRSVYGYKILPNIPGEKTLLSDSSKYQHLSSGEIHSGVEKWNDYFGIISARESYNGSGDSIKIGIAVAVGQSLSDLEYGFLKAYNYYNITTGADDIVDGSVLPVNFKLNQNYPNPFNMSTTISFSLESPGHVQLDIFNILGQKVVQLANGLYSAGNVSINWDGRDAIGNEL